MKRILFSRTGYNKSPEEKRSATNNWQMRKALWLINLRMLYMLLPNNARSHACHMEKSVKISTILIPGHTIATCQHNIVGCNMYDRLATMLRLAATCWVLWAQVWKWSNLSQHHLTSRNRVAKCRQHVAPNNVEMCCVGMLRSFGWGFSVDQSSLKQLSLTHWHLNLLASVSCSQSSNLQIHFIVRGVSLSYSQIYRGFFQYIYLLLSKGLCGSLLSGSKEVYSNQHIKMWA